MERDTFSRESTTSVESSKTPRENLFDNQQVQQVVRGDSYSLIKLDHGISVSVRIRVLDAESRIRRAECRATHAECREIRNQTTGE